MRNATRLIVAIASITCAMAVAPTVANAVLSGANGRIVFVSGREPAADATAKVFLRTAIGSFATGMATGPLNSVSGQSRHPTWSPDRTKIAYAGGSTCTPDCDIYVLDLTNPFALPMNITNTATHEDRPAWSPDSTRIAYEAENGAQQDIIVQDVASGTTLNLTGASAAVDGKPAWSPNSQEIYYSIGPTQANPGAGIYKEPANNSGPVTTITDAGGNISEYQPSVSPDGTKICFTRQLDAANIATADVIVSLANGGGQTDLSDDAVAANYNCTWSPDGTKIAYVTGAFSAGDLVMENSDDSSGFAFTLESIPGRFDGNPDWAPDARPVCRPATVDTGFNQPVTVPLDCRDVGPLYERTSVQEFVSQDPTKGTVGDVTLGDDDSISTVLYTPNAGSSGTDTFQINSFDQIAGFGEPVTVTVNVNAPPVLSNLAAKRRIKKGKALPKRSSGRRGTTITFTLSEDATVTLSFVRRGRASSSVKRGSFKINGKQGLNRVVFSGRLSRSRSLDVGRYRVSAQAVDAQGAQSVVDAADFLLWQR